MSDSEEMEFESDELDESMEEMVVENGMLMHALINVLIRKNVVSGDEIDAEMTRLYETLSNEASGEDDE